MITIESLSLNLLTTRLADLRFVDTSVPLDGFKYRIINPDHKPLVILVRDYKRNNLHLRMLTTKGLAVAATTTMVFNRTAKDASNTVIALNDINTMRRR